MGSHGPIPKRAAERRRENKPAVPIDTLDVTGPVKIPPACRNWHPIARRLYNSLKVSGQSKFFEPSDWSAAYLLAESLSRDLKPKVVGTIKLTGEIVRAYMPLNGSALTAYLKGFAVLGVCEGDRRRMSIEIERKQEKPELAAVSVMDEYREALG
jgi:hypothetical protein